MLQGAASRVAPRAHGAALLNHAELPECFKVRRHGWRRALVNRAELPECLEVRRHGWRRAPTAPHC